MHQAATTAQLILVATAIAASLVFQRHKTVDWRLALLIEPPTTIMAFIGGYYAHVFSSMALKFVFSGLLVLASFFMLRPVKERVGEDKKRVGFWRRQYGRYEYTVNLWLAIPITAATGLAAGMVGVSGGSFKVPLMVLACGVPMHTAVGTASTLIAATALMGFSGHAIRGDFDASWAIPLAFITVFGGIIGGKFAMKTKPKHLKELFAYTNWAAAIFMVINAFRT